MASAQACLFLTYEQLQLCRELLDYHIRLINDRLRNVSPSDVSVCEKFVDLASGVRFKVIEAQSQF